MHNLTIPSFLRFSHIDPGKYGVSKPVVKPGFLAYYLKVLLPLLLLFTFNVSPSQAQGAYFWSEQEKIPQYAVLTEEPPYLIADLNHTVHAFNAQPLNLDDPVSPKAVFYRQWTIDSGWTYPNDILFDPDGNNLNLLGVAYDQSDRVDLIILKGTNIYFTQNYLANSNNAASWPDPVLIAGNSSGFGPGYEIVAAISTNPDGNEIVVIFAGQQDGKGLYFTNSSDGGDTWSNPYPIYLTGNESMTVTDPKLFIDATGVLHAVWATFLDDGFGGPGFYASFDPGTKVWSEPIELDAPGIRTPSVIENQGEIFISYYHENVNGNWWRRSRDNGKTWSLPEQFSPRHVGTNGAVSLAVDGNNVLHAFFGERIDGNNHGVWHVMFTGSAWTNLESVVRGPQMRETSGGNGFDPRSARAVIVNGNLALVTWGTDGFAGVNGAWYSYKRLDASELPGVALEGPLVLPQSTSSQVVVEATTATITVDATPGNNAIIIDERPEFVQNPQYSIFIGVIPVVLLLLGMVMAYYLFQEKNK